MVFDTVKQLMVDQLKVPEDAISMDTDMITDLEADSLDAVEVIMAIEDEYDLNIPDESAEKLRTLRDIVNYIEARIG